MSTPYASLKKTRKVPLRPLLGVTPSPRDYGQLNSDTAARTTDHDLLGLMASRLSVAEGKLRLQSKEIAEKDMKIQILEEKVKLLSMRVNECNKSSKTSEIDRKYLQLQKQIIEMEDFLGDYGLMWVGTNSELTDSDSEDEGKTSNSIWSQSQSLPREPTVDFNLLVTRINELNIMSGEGVFKIEHTTDGARLKAPDPINFILYANGIILFSGPFRSYSDPSTQDMLRDILDGYFPSELQSRYPDGVPFKVTDRRNVQFKDARAELFNGEGQTVGGQAATSRLLHDSHGVIARHTTSTTRLSEETELPGPKLTIDQFVNKLPKCVIRKGQVVDIRKSVQEYINPSPVHTVPRVIDCRTSIGDISETETSPSGKHCINLRVISEGGENVRILKMYDTNTVGDLRRQLDKERKPGSSRQYTIVSSFPHRVYDDDTATLLQCGLTSNITLHLR